ncbi:MULTISPECIES: HupE/UreJ family protein [unclassified Arthrobacter]|uniref:HupE/UreJ family protein n=1 Tax=unclassified Arthrobacter TaxID=235627 RepID=UPI001C8620CA|nr:HupE/UreJ family protein [Arthrobacter sp. MAHUQ-56]MBX7442538.1 HupE/UreJ family protein [Arthrobacter sp. MAHUQ-56]
MPAFRPVAARRNLEPKTRLRVLLAALAVMMSAIVFGAAPAYAHVLPTSSVQLDVREDVIDATAKIPMDDLEAALGLDLGDQSAATVAGNAAAISAYLLQHFAPTSDDGQAWTVQLNGLGATEAGDTSTTGLYQELDATFTLTPPAGSDARSFNLGYSAVVDQVVTHVVLVSVDSGWSAGVVAPYAAGTIRLDTVSGQVTPLHMSLGQGNNVSGFLSMFVLGVQHIQEGTDHQLFLLTLLVPAPLIAGARRWARPAPVKKAVRRIAAITLAFTIGHSATLALGALGMPVPTGVIEASIAVSILIAAIHAIRPVFAGKEIFVAGFFGLVHGLAFSETLRGLDLTGPRLALSLLGFNLGIEAMQLTVVALVLPPLLVLASTGHYRRLRILAASAAGIAAVGWLAARLGLPNTVADLADNLGVMSLPVIALLWLGAATTLVRSCRRKRRSPAFVPDPAGSPAAVSST